MTSIFYWVFIKFIDILFRAFSLLETEYLMIAWNNTSLEKMEINRKYFNYKATTLIPLADVFNHEFRKSTNKTEHHDFQLVGQKFSLNFMLVGSLTMNQEIKFEYIRDCYNSYMMLSYGISSMQNINDKFLLYTQTAIGRRGYSKFIILFNLPIILIWANIEISLVTQS